MPRSWLRRNIPRGERKKVAASIKKLRHEHFFMVSNRRNRNLDYIWGRLHFDFNLFVGELLEEHPEQQHLNILDSGAGFWGVTADLKREFGGSVFITALNIANAKPLAATDEEAMRIIKKRSGMPVRREHLKAQVELLKKAQQNAALADERRVGLIERFATHRRFDIVVDFFGPLQHSRFPHRVLEVYFHLLKPDARILFAAEPKFVERAQNLINGRFGEGSEAAKETGHCLSMRQLSRSKVFEIRKVRAAKAG